MLLRTLDTTRSTSPLTTSLDPVGSLGVPQANKRVTVARATVTCLSETDMKLFTGRALAPNP